MGASETGRRSNGHSGITHGVGEETAILPEGWRERLVLMCGENTSFVRGWCLEVHDLAISKHVAGREKDIEFTESLARHGMVSRDVLEERLAATAMAHEVRSLVARRIEAQFADG